MQKNIIVAISDNNAIGKDNALLWHISADMKFFRRQTLGSPVIMGRKTFESIGRALPGRVNIVISRGFSTGEDVDVVGSLEEAFQCSTMSSFVASHFVDGVVDMAKPAFVEKVRNIKENNNFFGTTFQSNWYELTITFNIF